MTKKVALYLRVSTKEQTTANQRLELERWAIAHGYQVVAVYEDHGISGAKGRDRRPEFDRALKDATRRKFDVFAAWDVSRVGRSLPHLVDTLGELHAAGVDLYLHQQGLSTLTPAGKALFGMSAVFAEYERAVAVERVNAGLARARTNGTRSGRPIGRPALSHVVRDAARAALRAGLSVRRAMKASGASNGSVCVMRKQMLAAGEIAA
jgi:DNA invertase Pin-like site-specific DNA recombinase